MNIGRVLSLTSRVHSTGAGFVLSILGTVFLFIGQLVSFARTWKAFPIISH